MGKIPLFSIIFTSVINQRRSYPIYRCLKTKEEKRGRCSPAWGLLDVEWSQIYEKIGLYL